MWSFLCLNCNIVILKPVCVCVVAMAKNKKDKVCEMNFPILLILNNIVETIYIIIHYDMLCDHLAVCITLMN